MNRVMTFRSNSNSNCPFGLFLSEQICRQSDKWHPSHLRKHAIRRDPRRDGQGSLLLDLGSELGDDFGGCHVVVRHVGRDTGCELRDESDGDILEVALVETCHHEIFVVLRFSEGAISDTNLEEDFANGFGCVDVQVEVKRDPSSQRRYVWAVDRRTG